MASIGVIINPQAGGNLRNGVREAAFRAALGSRGVVIATGSPDELPAAARQLAARGIDTLGVCGGDGSFYHTLSACLPAFAGHPLPAFLPLPAGSMNTIASALGWRRSDLATTLRCVAAGDFDGIRTVERELIQVNGTGYGFMVGAGVIVNFLAAYYREPGRGPIAAARVVARLVSSALTGGSLGRELFASVPANVRADDHVLPWQSYNILYASTVSELGLGFKIAYRAGTVPDTFHVLAGEPRLSQLVWKLPQMKRGRATRADALHDDLAKTLTVEFPGSSRYMVDGEILAPVDRLELRTGPRLRILVG